jgi:hypothetical protein
VARLGTDVAGLVGGTLVRRVGVYGAAGVAYAVRTVGFYVSREIAAETDYAGGRGGRACRSEVAASRDGLS